MRTVFDTEWGPFAVRWSDRGITRLELPPAGPGRAGGPLPPFVKRAVRQVREYLGGRRSSFDVPLDPGPLTPFRAKVYRCLRRVGAGRTVTYGGLAAMAGRPSAARAVGTAMARNPLPLFIPCHRVLACGGGLGGFGGPGGVKLKKRLLELEA